MKQYVLVINPGSTSTKVAIFKERQKIIQRQLDHSIYDINRFEKISDQFSYRRDMVIHWLESEGFKINQLKAVVGRGGLLKSIPSGTYFVTDAMIEDLKMGIQGEHASNLGGMIAKSIADLSGIHAYIVDPVSVDEFYDIARISGIPEIKRRSLLHALNIKAVTHKILKETRKDINECNLIVAHLGGGISIVPIKNGKMIDANNANQAGPFSPERAGSLPVGDIVSMCFSKKYTVEEIKKKISGRGGLVAYLGTNDAREVEKMIKNGDQKSKLIYEAMGYQISKEIGAMAAVLKGKVDLIILTGGLAYSEILISYIKERVEFIAPIVVQPGEDEMSALNEGINRVLNGEEKAKIYV